MVPATSWMDTPCSSTDRQKAWPPASGSRFSAMSYRLRTCRACASTAHNARVLLA